MPVTNKFLWFLYNAIMPYLAILIMWFMRHDTFVEIESKRLFRITINRLKNTQRHYLERQRATATWPERTDDAYAWSVHDEGLVFRVHQDVLMTPEHLKVHAIQDAILIFLPIHEVLDDLTTHLSLLPEIRAEVQASVKPMLEHKLAHPWVLEEQCTSAANT